MFCILDLKTGKVKTTHHVKFNHLFFPNKSQINLDQNTESFGICGSLDIPTNSQTNSNCLDSPKTPNNLELSPNHQRKDDENQNVTTNTL
ncbi:hypothetical protein O181_064967 [Austropuccinia psidii MF-1]|uniref:Uncharacterized protein n=1 Tax=Austropuccinia psidii MF-1 TaxID=1389203 RepID=A0A9Q3I2V8_9BASI|nr:hypothetical protein [Austropuccinia psidii MF-1]